MANADNPRGFAPMRHRSGGVIRPNRYTIASAYAIDIFTGDLVKLVAGGTIELATAGDRTLGSFAGCEYVNSDGEQKFSKYWPASTAILSGTTAYAHVYDDPNLSFRAQCEGSVAITEIGQLTNMISTHAGSTLTGQSGQEVDDTTGTSSAQLRIVGIVEDPENAWGTNVELEVMIFKHEFAFHDQSVPGV